MKKIVLIIFILSLFAGCNNGRGNSDGENNNIFSPTSPNISLNHITEISILNYEVELLGYSLSDSSVKFRLMFKNSGDINLEKISIVFVGDTSPNGSSNWVEEIMWAEKNIYLAPGDIYKSINYDGAIWYYFIHNNAGQWTGSHYITYFICDDDSSILATGTLYYDEVF